MVISVMTIGKRIRMERIKDRKSGNSLIIPLDHGISEGPIKGIVGLADTIEKVSEGGANAVLQQKGMVPYGHRGYGRDIGLIVHMSASTRLGPDPNNKVMVCSVEEALKMGADAVACTSTSAVRRRATSSRPSARRPGAVRSGACRCLP